MVYSPCGRIGRGSYFGASTWTETNSKRSIGDAPSLTLSNADAVLAGAIITASMTFWAIYMALYVFVFRYFLTKPEVEKFRKGWTYFRFFIKVEVVSFELVLSVVLSIVALVIESEYPLAVAASAFVANLAFGTVAIVQEIRTTQAHVFTYAIPEFLVRTLSKKGFKKMRRDVKKLTSREAAEKFVQDTLASLIENMQKPGSESEDTKKA